MNTQQPTPRYTLESIRLLRTEKKDELKLSQQRMHDLAQQLFSPQQSKNTLDGWMQHINSGIAAYDGIMTGLRILKRLRALFGKKRRR